MATIVAFLNAYAGPAALVGGFLGGLAGSRASVRKKWRVEAREEARTVVLDHCRSCPRADGAAPGIA